MKIYYYVDARGNSPVKKFIDELPIKEQAKVFAYIEELRNQGHNIRRPLADYVKNGVYELRPKANRLFYFFFLKENIVIVHAIKKKTNKISEKDITLCLQRKSYIEKYKTNILPEK